MKKLNQNEIKELTYKNIDFFIKSNYKDHKFYELMLTPFIKNNISDLRKFRMTDPFYVYFKVLKHYEQHPTDSSKIIAEKFNNVISRTTVSRLIQGNSNASGKFNIIKNIYLFLKDNEIESDEDFEKISSILHECLSFLRLKFNRVIKEINKKKNKNEVLTKHSSNVIQSVKDNQKKIQEKIKKSKNIDDENDLDIKNALEKISNVYFSDATKSIENILSFKKTKEKLGKKVNIITYGKATTNPTILKLKMNYSI